jgi:serine/threonine protein kinase
MEEQRLGQYVVTHLIGHGGMGKVYEASAPDGRRVAIKVLVHPEGTPPTLRDEAVARFQREGRAAQLLNHPNIVSVFEVGDQEGTPFIVMEFIEGESVRDLVNMAGSIRLERALEIISQVCNALGHAHDKGVVHRDIKPENIMVPRDGRVKLTDFGLAIAPSEATLTRTGSVMGTFSYMSPEQARGEKVDLRSDIFSLGATLYEMLSGRKAFDGDSPASIIEKVLNQDPATLDWLPPGVSRAINRCLRKNPKYRFQSAVELLVSMEGAPGVEAPVTADGQIGTVLDTGALARSQRVAALDARADLAVTTRCPRCGEPWPPKSARCWKCDLPDPRARPSRAQQWAAQQVAEALRVMNRKKRWWQIWK